MTYKGPTMIREPELRWPIVVLAGTFTTLIALLVTFLFYLVMTTY
jgi:hypothetical protein